MTTHLDRFIVQGKDVKELIEKVRKIFQDPEMFGHPCGDNKITKFSHDLDIYGIEIIGIKGFYSVNKDSKFFQFRGNFFKLISGFDVDFHLTFSIDEGPVEYVIGNFSEIEDNWKRISFY